MRKGLGFHNRHSAGVFNPASLFAGGTVQGAWYDPSDLTTLFQDSAGTTPVTAVEQPVGLMLDKRSTPYSVFFDGTGDYLTSDGSAGFAFGTGDFTVEFWIYFASVTNQQNFIDFRNSAGVGNGLVIYKNASNQLDVFTGGGSVIVGSALSAGVWYHIALARSGTSTKLFLNGSQVGSTFNDTTNYTAGTNAPSIGSSFASNYVNGYISNLRIVKGTAVYTGNFTPPTAPLSPIAGTSLLTCGTTWSGNPAITRNGDARADKLNPFTTGTGNHAYQSINTSRPTLRARYNLLTYSEEFENAAWGKSNATITQNAVVAPDGTATAEGYSGTSGTASYFNQSVGVSSGVGYSFSIYAKANSTNILQVAGGSIGFASSFANFDLSDGSIGTVSGCIAAISFAGNGWWKCQVTQTAAAGDLNNFFIALVSLKTSARVAALTANASVFVWGAQLVPTAVFPSNTYQRVGAATDYATGAAFPPYLFFDGTDDSMLTNSVDFTGTDKMLVVAGVTKNSDAVNGIVVELSADSSVNNGSFAYSVAATGANSFMRSRGTASASGVASGTPAAPVSMVSTIVGNIGGDVAQLYENRVLTFNSTADQGTGNYGNYPLYIGRRNNATIPFNGNLYSLIIAGQSYSSGQISSTESWVAAKTPLGTI